MKRISCLLTICLFILLSSCTNRKVTTKTNTIASNQLDIVAELMTGNFSSNAQSLRDSLFYDISLTMVPIWKGDANVKWLYVEQAESTNMKKPYRQRVYRLSLMHDRSVESRVYTLPEPSNFIHAWERPELLKQISPASLTLREGCAVYLKKDETGCYSGSTIEQECKSTMRGAAYATSLVIVCADEIVSWDQGWDVDRKQVWGAETEGYVFKRIKADSN